MNRTTVSPFDELPSEGRRRVTVLAIEPEIDAGRYPVKRILGDRLAVTAHVITDGHDALRAALLHRHESEADWTEVGLEHAANDAWRGAFELGRLGRHVYTAVAWVDAFATWRHGLERKVAAGTDVTLELLEGAALVEAAAERTSGADRALLREAAETLRARSPVETRVATATGAALAAAMACAPDRSRETRFARELEVVVEQPLALFSSWYEMFPRSAGPAGRHGTFRDGEARLDYVAELGFDILYLPPIHPIGRAYRKGPDNAPTAGSGDPGSPWAIGGPEGGHTSVHPELGTLDDFDRFVRAARERGIQVALDLAFQASPDHPWVKQHPSWFRQRPDGSVQYAENPPKKYQDVYPFDFDSDDWRELWMALRGIVLHWIEHGISIFRVDNPHTKPIPFWEWCIRTVKARHPETVFLSEAFTRPKLMYALAKSGFSQSYTYFTWRTTKDELEAYIGELTRPPVAEFFRPNLWPTTPDIFPEHLQHGGRAAFVSRLILAGTLSSAYGIYGPSYELMERVPRPGAEELAHNEKYEVRTWDLERAGSLRHAIARLNRIRRAHPALQDNRSLRFHRTDNDFLICYSKRTEDRKDVIVTVVNLDPHHTHSGWLDLDLDELGLRPDESFQAHDLLGGSRFQWRGPRAFVSLSPEEMPAHILEIRRFVRSENMFEYFL
jgi:starch synthase (maltosyl-transferring)